MKFVYPEIDHEFEISSDKINTIVIENQRLMSNLLTDLSRQLNGAEGRAVVYDNYKIQRTDKYLELLTSFFPLEINKRPLLTKICNELEKNALTGENYVETLEVLQRLEALLVKLSLDISCDIDYNKLDIGTLIKAVGVFLTDDCDTLCERIVNYFKLVTEFDHAKLFVTLNLRSFVCDDEMNIFMKTILGHDFKLLMIESFEHPLLELENRYIIDSDLCEIC